MAGEEFVPRIDAAKAAKEVLKPRMEAAATQFVAGVVPYVRDWIDSTARRLVEANPERTKELGADQLRAARGELEQVKAEMSAEAERIFGALWVHRDDTWEAPADRRRINPYVGHKGQISSQIVESLREVSAPAFQILRKHQLTGQEQSRRLSEIS